MRPARINAASVDDKQTPKAILKFLIAGVLGEVVHFRFSVLTLIYFYFLIQGETSHIRVKEDYGKGGRKERFTIPQSKLLAPEGPLEGISKLFPNPSMKALRGNNPRSRTVCE